MSGVEDGCAIWINTVVPAIFEYMTASENAPDNHSPAPSHADQSEPDANAKNPPEPTHRPLDGLNVVELAQWVAGPSAAGLMADWGANVIKVEPPAGDPQRRIYAALGVDKKLPNPAFAQDNRGKRSIVLNLSDPAAKSIFHDLLAQADIFITNLRPNALDRLGLNPSELARKYPRLIVGAQSGYGSVGPERDTPGYDIGAFVARTGIAATNRPDEDPPINLRSGIGDHATGVTTCAGLLAALYERTVTGKGKVIETSLFQTGLYVESMDLGTHLTIGRLGRMRHRSQSRTPLANSYQANDGKWFYLIGIEAERHFPGVCAVIEQPDLAQDERFASAVLIRKNREDLIAILDDAFGAKPLSHWANAFDEHDVWWAPCQTIAEVAVDPQALALDSYLATDDGDQQLTTVASPVRFDGQTMPPAGPVPALGQHTDEILGELE